MLAQAMDASTTVGHTIQAATAATMLVAPGAAIAEVITSMPARTTITVVISAEAAPFG